MASSAALSTVGTADDIDNYAAIVLAAIGAGGVSLAQVATFAGGEALAGYCMMRTPLGGLGSVATHSNYHMNGLYRFWANAQPCTKGGPVVPAQALAGNNTSMIEGPIAFVNVEMPGGMLQSQLLHMMVATDLGCNRCK